MLRVPRNALSPWIESLIRSYGSEEGSNGGRLKAHVTSVGQMSQSQARNSEGPTGLLFLSDGVVQMPAILTSSAWEHLQEQEDKECFTSLLNTTVCVRDYRLQFHMATEPTRCRFFLSVGEMLTTAAGRAKDNTPCCTSSLSVQQKIYETWRTLLVRETQDSPKSHTDFDLSDLLGEWQRDSLQTVLEDVRERLMVPRSASLQPFTSTAVASVNQLDMFTPTGWDIERAADNATGCFSIPIKCLLIPEGCAMQGQKANADVLTTDGDRELNLQLSESTVNTEGCQTAELTEGVGETQNYVDNIMHHDNIHVNLTNKDLTASAKAWEMFLPPRCFSFSDGSQEAIAVQSIQFHRQNCHVNRTSTQLPITSTQPENLQHSKGNHSSLPPYQKLPLSSGGSYTATPTSQMPPQDKQTLIENVDMQQITVGRQYRMTMRKRDLECVQEERTTVAVEEARKSGSPPSWLFDSGTGSGTVGGSIDIQTLATEQGKTTVHTDSVPFSYTYNVSGQNLHDFNQFTVEESLLSWAVKYLVLPKQTTHL
ncbi:adrenocortical dysplasia protein homolog [Phyllopteryx taeniolatus]|uniref:adrenocortical dysplasia protein homolog n=1 Tax=Phyllopteryx taeniolatus TaxID=161469 RepID=UPI002AD4CD2F|nr:adrenocortical dysplasia protein homolog [Phyllopteryx taeniolatus]XP_061629931.1 adrenocortical dysplasia protein homolog [Phyllopteryx taeniolatus]XP_061629932.1 adrenocortical dysplasia protein homolog [Phyllopteryx taeniolatus]XP_061629933.1 adrenocortical dysplasia protein homolog [Phyllopteryx taeniolatus]